MIFTRIFQKKRKIRKFWRQNSIVFGADLLFLCSLNDLLGIEGTKTIINLDYAGAVNSYFCVCVVFKGKRMIRIGKNVLLNYFKYKSACNVADELYFKLGWNYKIIIEKF